MPDQIDNNRRYPLRPWVGIGVVVHNANKVLLIKRGKEPNKGRWSLPGGAQHIGETIFEGAKREVFEETGINIFRHHFIDAIDSITHDQDGKIEYHYSLIEIGCEYQSGDLCAKDDADEAIWVDINSIANFDLPDKTQQIIWASYRSWKASLTEE